MGVGGGAGEGMIVREEELTFCGGVVVVLSVSEPVWHTYVFLPVKKILCPRGTGREWVHNPT